MKAKLFTALAVSLVLLPAGASFAFSEGGGVYVFAPRYFASNDSRTVARYRSKYSGSPNKEMQAELNRLGYYHGPIDGNINPGSRTSVAIGLYQRDHGMRVTGVIDGALFAALCGR